MIKGVLASLCLGAISCVPSLPPEPAVIPTVVAAYDPTANPPQVPSPNDLTLSAMMMEGFAPTATVRVRFSNKIAESSLTANAFLIVDLETGQAIPSAEFTFARDADEKGFAISKIMGFATHRFAAFVWGGDDSAGLRGAAGEIVVAAPTFFFLRSPEPVLGLCGNVANPACACPDEVVAAADPADETCHSLIVGMSNEEARRLEGGRRALAPLLNAVAPPSRDRQDLVAAWTFTIVSAN